MNRDITYRQVQGYQYPKNPGMVGKYGAVLEEYIRNSQIEDYYPWWSHNRREQYLRKNNKSIKRKIKQLERKILMRSPAPDMNIDKKSWKLYMDTVHLRAEEIIMHEMVNKYTLNNNWNMKKAS